MTEATAVALIALVVSAYVVAALINKRSQRWKDHKVYVRLGPNVHAEIVGYSPKQARRLALLLMNDTKEQS